MSSLRSRVQALEQRFGHADGAQQLTLLVAAIRGDREARRKFEQLHAAGKTQGRLHEILDALAVSEERSNETEETQ